VVLVYHTEDYEECKRLAPSLAWKAQWLREAMGIVFGKMHVTPYFTTMTTICSAHVFQILDLGHAYARHSNPPPRAAHAAPRARFAAHKTGRRPRQVRERRKLLVRRDAALFDGAGQGDHGVRAGAQ
jgi:hypothetical protein